MTEQPIPTIDGASSQPPPEVIVEGRGFKLFDKGCFSCNKSMDEKEFDRSAIGDLDTFDGIPAENRHLVGGAEEFAMKRQYRFDVNMYATKKSAANGLMDLALLMANASQLKHILLTGTEEGRQATAHLLTLSLTIDPHVEQGTDHQFYHAMLILLLCSIFLQVVIGVALLYLARQRVQEDISTDEAAKRTRRAECVNNWVVCLIFVLTVINVFISAFGLNQTTQGRSTVGKAA